MQNKDFWKAKRHEQNWNTTDSFHLQQPSILPNSQFCLSCFGRHHIYFMQSWGYPVNWVLKKDQLFLLSGPGSVWCEEDISHVRAFSVISEAPCRKSKGFPDLQVPIPFLIFFGFFWGSREFPEENMSCFSCQVDKEATSWNVTVNKTFRRHLLEDFRALSSPFKINGKSPIDLNELGEAVIVETKPEATLAQ